MILSFTFLAASASEFKYHDSWGKNGLSLKRQNADGIGLNFSIQEFRFAERDINGIQMTGIEFSESMLQNDEGAPDLPGFGRYIAIPQGATPVIEIVNMRTERFTDVEIAPAPRIPLDTDQGPLYYEKNQTIYSKNEFYPAQTVLLGDFSKIRGVDVAMLGITPYQYNPVTKELIVYRDIEINIRFEGGNREFGEEKYRNPYWDVIMEDVIFNYSSLPEIDYSSRAVNYNNRSTGWEYVIITPNNEIFTQWADSIKKFRTEEGIYTGIVKLSEIGENVNAGMLEAYVNQAYNTWDIPPVAILLLGDYGTAAQNDNSIISPIYNNYCVSDNILADVSGNHMPDIVFARITAQNAAQLESMIGRFLNYERRPPVNPAFYANPITALGWQTERWFQICSETVGGFWKNALGKTPVRINEIYQGTPGAIWSTATNTSTVVGVFGPAGLGYIPATPSELGNWSGGNASQINNALNAGSFMLMHRDHGYEYGWGEPSYTNSSINGLTNTDLSFILSINCLTGKYNHSSESFTEKFHRHTFMGQPAGALGLTAASEVSYSFVNDVYVWGMMDNMWPAFMPQYGAVPGPRGILPAFGNAAGKYFLQQSNWPYNTNNKQVTYNLFHHHGDAFLKVCSEVPQNISAIYDTEIYESETVFTITATPNSKVSLTAGDEILGTGTTGFIATIDIAIPAQPAGTRIKVVITNSNFNRYEGWVDVIPMVTSAMAGDDMIICEGVETLLNGSANNYTSLLWETNGNGTFSDASILNPIYTPSAEDYTLGSVVLSLTAMNPQIGDSTDFMNLAFQPAPVIAAENTVNLCAGESFNVGIIIENQTSVTWSTSGDGTFDDPANITPNYTPGNSDIESGNVVLTVAAANEFCEPVEFQIELLIHALPEPLIQGPESVCQFVQEVAYMAASEGNEYLWDVTGGSITAGQNTVAPTVTWETPGTGIITLTETNLSGCSQSITFEVEIKAAPTPAIGGNERVCANSEQNIYSTPAVEGNTYEWIATGGNIVSGANSQEVTVNWGGNGSGLLTLVETNVSNTCASQAEFNVLISSPEINLGADTTICLTHVLMLTGQSGFNSYTWSTGETTQSIQLSGQALGISSASYSLNITDEFGCLGTDAILVTVEACTGIEEISDVAGITILPNPSDGNFTLEMNSAASGKTHISIINTQGKVLYNKNVVISQLYHKETLQLNIGSGVYMIRIESEIGSFIRKLVIN